MLSPASARCSLLATAKLAEWARHSRAALGGDGGSGGGGGGGASSGGVGGGGGGGGAVHGALRPAPWAEALSEAARAGKDALWDVLASVASVRRHMMGGR